MTSYFTYKTYKDWTKQATYLSSFYKLRRTLQRDQMVSQSPEYLINHLIVMFEQQQQWAPHSFTWACKATKEGGLKWACWDCNHRTWRKEQPGQDDIGEDIQSWSSFYKTKSQYFLFFLLLSNNSNNSKRKLLYQIE